MDLQIHSGCSEQSLLLQNLVSSEMRQKGSQCVDGSRHEPVQAAGTSFWQQFGSQETGQILQLQFISHKNNSVQSCFFPPVIFTP